MKVNVGSKNEIKIKAVEEILKDYPMFFGAGVQGVDILAPEFGQPKTLSETIAGAKRRAQDCFLNCDYSFGIESGLIEVPETKTGYMDVTVCAIFDGKIYHLGLSSAFEYPKKVTELMITENLDGSQAYRQAGLTQEQKIGANGGVISHLTKGRLDRKEYTKQALINALVHLENPELY